MKVMARNCDECLMTDKRIVSASRAAAIIKETKRKDCHFICHKGTIAGEDIACHGHAKAVVPQLYRIMGRLGAIEEIDPDTMQPLAQGQQNEGAES
jgi:hypothetical protein